MLKKRHQDEPVTAENITFALNGEEGIKNSAVYDETGKKLTGRRAKDQLKKAKKMAELAENPDYLKAVQQALADRAKNNRA